MSNFFTSDTHFGHRNVIDYCDRPFKEGMLYKVAEMDNYLVSMWNAIVKPTDTVYFLGDFAMNPLHGDRTASSLNGRRVWIPGNHDNVFDFLPKLPYDKKCVEATKARHEKFLKRALDNGWEAVHQTLMLELKDGTNVLLSHLPYAPKADQHGLDLRYMEYRPKDDGMILLHGHLHGRYKKMGNQIDVGVDAHGLKILSEDQVLELIYDPQTFIPSSLTNFYKTRKENPHALS